MCPDKHTEYTNIPFKMIVQIWEFQVIHSTYVFQDEFRFFITMIKWFGLRLKYIVGKMTGKKQKQTYQMYQP